MNTPDGYPSTRKDDIVVQELHKEILVYDLKINKAYCLNETSALVWRECDGTRGANEISRRVSSRMGAAVSEDIVWLALNQLKTDNLLDESGSFTTPLDGMNRREIVRRIGFASMVALPVISSLVAPRAAWAQSVNNCGPIGNCTAGSTLCICTPPVQPGSNNNPDGCRCLTNGDCVGNCSCGNPCTAGPPCPTGETCQSGICRNSQGGGSLALCNGSCPQGTTCITDQSQSNVGSCSGVCPSSPFNFCVGGGTSAQICIPNNGGNLSAPCCPCSIDGDCQGDCSNNNQGPPGVCI